MDKATAWEQTHCLKSLQRTYPGNTSEEYMTEVRIYASDDTRMGTTSNSCNL